MERSERRKQNGHDKNSTQPKINQIASQLAKNKGLDNLTTALLSIKTETLDSKQNGTSETLLTDGPLHIKIEKIESMQPATAAALDLKPVSTSTINQIANQLANSKGQQTGHPDLTKPAIITNNTKDIKPSTVVGKMSEALSLKQSPTLTKQLATPISGTTNKMQVITQYMCRYCGQQFDSPTLMQQHIQDHVQGKAPHQCSVCGKEYRTPSKLQRHVRVHSGERPYACSVCGRRFTRSDHVKQHMKVHTQPKDQNTCHVCNGMTFNRRQALHLHLQQQHMIQCVFTCHRCGEAYESLEELQSHKLTHDSILNSMKDSNDSTGTVKGVAKFALGPQKYEEMNKFDVIKPESNPMDMLKDAEILGNSSNGYYVPANLDNVSALSNKLLLEGMEKMAKEAAEIEVQKKYQAELVKLNVDAKQYHEEKKRELEEQAKIAECFTIKADGTKEKTDEDYKPMEDDGAENSGLNQKTMVSADGMSMFILPTTLDDSVDSNNQEISDMEKEEDEESEQNSSKESAGINREGVTDKADGEGEEKMETNDETSDLNESEETSGEKDTKEGGISIKQTGSKAGRYTKPCPKSKKPGYIAPKPTLDIRIVTGDEADLARSRPMVSCINPKINELIKAKVEQSTNQAPALVNNTKTFSVSTVSQILNNPPAPKLAFLPSSTHIGAVGTQPLFLPVISGVTSLANSVPSPNQKPDMSKLLRCEHCCMWFEDTAMCLLHNTLHSADEADPFTCRKCYKKLGNRLEFMAHLVWHLEPNMDI